MPVTRPSLLEVKPSLLPGEDHINLKDDPYYGKVETGGSRGETAEVATARLRREVLGGVHALDVDEQNRIEVLTGVRLQQKAPLKREDLPPSELPAPVVSALEPNTVALGSPDFTISVKGEGFEEGAVIVWNGSDEVTIRVSDTELTTGVNMATAAVAVTIPVSVRNPDDTVSNELPFTFTEAGAPARSGGTPPPQAFPKKAH